MAFEAMRRLGCTTMIRTCERIWFANGAYGFLVYEFKQLVSSSSVRLVVVFFGFPANLKDLFDAIFSAGTVFGENFYS